jgi:hypothetical protein
MLKSYTEATMGITDETFFNKVFSGENITFKQYNDPINPILEKLISHRDAFQEQLTDDITFIKSKNKSVEREYWQHRKKAIEAAIEKMDEVINEPLKRTWTELKPVLEEASLSNVLSDGKNPQSVSDSTLFSDMEPDKFFRDSIEILKEEYQFEEQLNDKEDVEIKDDRNESLKVKGRKDILSEFVKFHNIGSWSGVRGKMKRNNINFKYEKKGRMKTPYITLGEIKQLQ